MRRPFVTTTCALALAVLPAGVFAQTPPAQPPQQPPPAQQEQQASSKLPATVFASDAGLIFNQIKPDQTAVFEQAMAKLQEALAKSTDPVRKQQAAGWKVYKATEPMGANALYVFVMDPAVKGGDYNMFNVLQEGLGDQAAREIWKGLTAAYGGPQNILNLSPVVKLGGM